MTSPTDVTAFHREFDRHPDDRVRLFATVGELVSDLTPARPPTAATVLYPGSYVDIGPSVWFDRVHYVDLDKRAARFFAQEEQVSDLVATKRVTAGNRSSATPSLAFHHRNYQTPLPIDDGTVDVLVSLYAGFISEHCTRYLAPGGLLVANNSHGDASMATLDPGYELAAVIQSGAGRYRAVTDDLDRYLVPKRGHSPTAAELHATNRGVAFTTSAFAYVFRRRPIAGAD